MTIPDPNMHLTLLQAAWDAGLLPPFDKAAFYRDSLGEDYRPDAPYNYQIDSSVRTTLLATPLPNEILEQLTTVVWDGGMDVHLLIWTYWDGESDEFDVHDLQGIEACKNLETLQFTAGSQFKEIAPLTGLPRLSNVLLLGDPISDLGPLLSLPSLAHLGVSYDPTSSNEAIMEQLRDRGVEMLML